MLPMLMMSPFPPPSRFLKIESIAWVMLIKPVTLVSNMTLISSSRMSGALAMPLTRPLRSEVSDEPAVVEDVTYALFTNTSISWKAAGSDSTKFRISSGCVTSSLTGRTCTPVPTSSLMLLTVSSKASTRRAARINLRCLDDVLANSIASPCQTAESIGKTMLATREPVLLPIPEEAPVIKMVLPSRRLAIAVDMVDLNELEKRKVWPESLAVRKREREWNIERVECQTEGEIIEKQSFY